LANFFEDKDRRVLPNWRSFGKTIMLGELNSIHTESKLPLSVLTIEDYVIDWKLNRTIAYASDLLSAALVNNFKENKDVVEAANYILKNENIVTKPQLSLAKKILNKKEEFDFSNFFQSVTLEGLTDFTNPSAVHQKIKETRHTIRIYPYNAILYVELSRYYSILGLKEKSIKAMKMALQLSKDNRFILRSAVRLFTHYDELEIAHDILRKNEITNYDPWLTSAEISIATIRERTSKFIKKGIELINSKNIAPFNFTELASSLGTVELLDGSTKKSREFFKKALINPNDNSLAQIEWASRKDKQLDINPADFGVRLNYEALALDNFQHEKHVDALDNAARWFIDMPFSIRPIMFGSNLASTILKDQEKAISFLNAGLISHPNDPQLINNLVYALVLENRTSEAIEYLGKIKPDTVLSETTSACLTATRGLTFFRSGLPDVGRSMYIEAIEKTKQLNNSALNWIAILNYAREEIRLGSEYVESIMEVVAKIPKDSSNIEVKTLRKDIISDYEKFKQKESDNPTTQGNIM
jgi:tetratricopeptide (TPR) repeat protein